MLLTELHMVTRSLGHSVMMWPWWANALSSTRAQTYGNLSIVPERSWRTANGGTHFRLVSASRYACRSQSHCCLRDDHSAWQPLFACLGRIWYACMLFCVGPELWTVVIICINGPSIHVKKGVGDIFKIACFSPW